MRRAEWSVATTFKSFNNSCNSLCGGLSCCHFHVHHNGSSCFLPAQIDVPEVELTLCYILLIK